MAGHLRQLQRRHVYELIVAFLLRGALTLYARNVVEPDVDKQRDARLAGSAGALRVRDARLEEERRRDAVPMTSVNTTCLPAAGCMTYSSRIVDSATVEPCVKSVKMSVDIDAGEEVR